MHVLIVGAGIGGLVLAQSLRKQGISFEIFDRDVDKNARFQGWAISIHTYVSLSLPNETSLLLGAGADMQAGSSTS